GWRAGFPVSARDRTVSRDVAFKIFASATGWRSLSVDAIQIDPVHAPSAPSASAAATCRPQPMPPAARTGVGATASTTSGTRTSVAISPVWPPASLPDATTMSTPASTWRRACSAVLGAGVRHGHHDVDAVRLPADVLVDPAELDLERLGRREGERAEDAEAAGLAHRRHDVATVAEGEDRKLDAEGVAEAGAH